jgi:hypothetical protein
MMCSIAENRAEGMEGNGGSLPKNGAKKRVLDVCARLFGGSSGTACSACWNYLEIEVKLRYYET